MLEVAGQRGPALEPGQGLLPQARLDEARPGRVLPRRRRRRADPPARAPDGDEALRERHQRGADLAEAGAEEPAGVAADGHGRLPVRPHRRGARRQRRGAPGVGGQPRRDRLQPAPGPPRRPRPSRTSCASTSTRRPEVGWAEVRKTAMVVDEVLTEHGLRGYPKMSGSKGIHVNVRIEPVHDYIEVRRAALALAREVERRAPDLATSKWWKEERHGVFVDYNQNARDRTVASAYCVRPTPDARVSCALRLGRGARRRAGRPAPRHRPGAPEDASATRRRTSTCVPGSLDAAARPRPPRRGGRPRRRALAAALPEAARRAQARAAVARHRPPDPPRPRRRPAARRPAARRHAAAAPSAASAPSRAPARVTRRTGRRRERPRAAGRPGAPGLSARRPRRSAGR